MSSLGDIPGFRVEEVLVEHAERRVEVGVREADGQRVAREQLSAELLEDPVAVERFARDNGGNLDADGRTIWLPRPAGRALAPTLGERRASFSKALETILAVAKGLRALHERDLVHGALCPEVIFVDDEQVPLRVTFLDVGMGALLRHVWRAREGLSLEAVRYCAPEQMRGRRIDAAADVYALGAVAYHLLLGRAPFEASTALDLMALHLTESPVEPRTLNPRLVPELSNILLTMLAKAPEERPRLDALIDRLERLRAQLLEDWEATPDSAGQRRRRTLRARAQELLALGAIVGGLALFAATRSTTAPPVADVKPTPASTEPLRPAAAASPAPRESALLIIRTNVPAAEIEVDEVAVASGAEGARVPLDRAGVHRLVVRAEGHAPYEKDVIVGANATVEINARLQRAKRKAPASAVRAPQKPRSAVPSGNYTLDPFGK